MLISNSPWTRRDFLRNLSLASSTFITGTHTILARAESALETTKIRLVFDPKAGSLCYAPVYFAEPLLRLEGFADITYAPYAPGPSATKVLAHNRADISASFGTDWVKAIDEGDDLVVLGGLHPGCLEVFANKNIRTFYDLKNKRVAVRLNAGGHLFLSAVAAYIGLDPKNDIEWVDSKPSEWSQLLAEGKVDAMGTFPPKSYAVHKEKIGHVILNTTTDEPWRHYFCCMVGARREFVANYPIATKRALRAIFKTNELCSLEPDSTARWLVQNKYAKNLDYTASTLRDLPYGAWRDFDPGDTLRFYALRLHEVGLIKHTPQQIIDQGTDWRFLNELKQELKA